MPSSDSEKTPTITFVKSNKKKRLLVVDGYLFQLNKSTAKVNYWICEEKSCGMGVHLGIDDSFIKFTKSDHTHMPAPERLQIRKLLTRVKKRVGHETTAVAKIYTEELSRSSLSTGALAMANTAKRANSGLHKVRRRNTPVLPSSMEFDIPSRYRKTFNGERYLLSDKAKYIDGDINGNIAERIIIYATDEQLRLLFTSSHIMMDGTFASCPPHFDQIYSIHSMRNNQSFLSVVAVLSGRSSEIYKELFVTLSQHASRLGLKFRPDTITTDFEQAIIKTIAEEFPNSRHIGCYFHYTNALIKKIQSLNLTTLYRDDEPSRVTIRQLMALPFIPPNYIEYAFNKVVRGAPEEMTPLINYFENFWVKKMRWNLWNIYGMEQRTNNMVEGWNHRFNRLVDKFHPNIWHLFDSFRIEEICVRQTMLQMAMGETKQKKKKSVDFQEHLNALQSQFEEEIINIDEFVAGLTLLLANKN